MAGPATRSRMNDKTAVQTIALPLTLQRLSLPLRDNDRSFNSCVYENRGLATKTYLMPLIVLQEIAGFVS